MSFPGQVPSRNPREFLVHKLRQRIERFFLPRLPFAQQFCELMALVHGHG